MSIRYDSLDSAVRSAMLQEVERDLDSGSLYQSPRLTDSGVQEWPRLLREAIRDHDDAWLADSLRNGGYIRAQEPRRKRDGTSSMVKVPYTAPDTLAEGEFNRFYARGLCADVVAGGGGEVEVYRGKAVDNPRSQSTAMIGTRIPAQSLLDDLRTAQGVEPALGLPPGPNSGLTVRRAR